MTSIVHTGYLITASQEFIEQIRQLENVDIANEITLAVMHADTSSWYNSRNDTNADQGTMRQWFEKNDGKETTVYVKTLHVYRKFLNEKKTKSQVLIVAKVTINGKFYYANLFNNAPHEWTPIKVKKFLCAQPTAFKEIELVDVKLSAVPYIKTQ
jgi:hypothetical protein